MKQLFLSMMILAVFLSCDNDDKPIGESKLPEEAQVLMYRYFSSESVTAAFKDDGEYEVYSTNYKIEFRKSGEWKKVEVKHGGSLSDIMGFAQNELPKKIMEWLGVNYPNALIVEIEKEFKGGTLVGYEIELNNGIDGLHFNREGVLLKGTMPLSSQQQNPDQETSTSPLMASLPESVQAFIKAHFPDNAVTKVKVDDDEYEVDMNGYELEFTLKGDWKKVDGKRKLAKLPVSFLALSPVDKINGYVAAKYPDRHIVEVEKDYERGILHYDVELDNGLDLEFDSEGKFLRIDK